MCCVCRGEVHFSSLASAAAAAATIHLTEQTPFSSKHGSATSKQPVLSTIHLFAYHKPFTHRSHPGAALTANGQRKTYCLTFAGKSQGHAGPLWHNLCISLASSAGKEPVPGRHTDSSCSFVPWRTRAAPICALHGTREGPALSRTACITFQAEL